MLLRWSVSRATACISVWTPQGLRSSRRHTSSTGQGPLSDGAALSASQLSEMLMDSTDEMPPPPVRSSLSATPDPFQRSGECVSPSAPSPADDSPIVECGAETLAASEQPPPRTGWSPQQQSFRRLLRALRSAYFHDRAALFWARHRVLVEFYKYSTLQPTPDTEPEASDSSSTSPESEKIRLLLGLTDEIAEFVQTYMKVDVGRIIRHNEEMMRLPAAEAKRLRDGFLLTEKQHESWCKQRIKAILRRRPPPPYPFT